MIAPLIVFALTVVSPTQVEVIDTYREFEECKEDAQHVRDFYQESGQTDVKVTCEATRNHGTALRRSVKIQSTH